MARALANECSSGEKKVAFFMRKGADCLSKWVGESERQLRLLFDQVQLPRQRYLDTVQASIIAVLTLKPCRSVVRPRHTVYCLYVGQSKPIHGHVIVPIHWLNPHHPPTDLLKSQYLPQILAAHWVKPIHVTLYDVMSLSP